MYTAQKDSHNNIIVCKGDRVRSGYAIVFTGTYNECLALKAHEQAHAAIQNKGRQS